ncbi:MAG: hypothetical protein MR031_00305 [Tenericutes bacterium]|nr:hypothetical protein [Mycoplasmatota bacterium]
MFRKKKETIDIIDEDDEEKKKKKKKSPRAKKSLEKRIAIKLSLCIVYLIAITILAVCAYRIYEDKVKVVPWEEVTTSDEYSYIVVSKMSEKFAYYSTNKKSIHFVIEKEKTGQWHAYLIAIEDSDYSKFKDIIDYTYDRTDKLPEPKKVFGYPVLINDELKQLALDNINNFLPADNEVEITADNFESYLTNSYLDTTLAKEDNFNIPLFAVLMTLVIIIVLFIITICDRDHIADDLDDILIEIRKKYLKK